MSKSKVPRGKVRRWIEYSLLLTGIVGVGLWSAANAIPVIWQDWENWVFDRDVQGQTASVGEYLASRTNQIARSLEQKLGMHVKPERSTAGSTASLPPPTRTTIGRNSLIGRLAIPRLHLRAIVREGDGNDTLSLTAGHIPGTAFPWQPGNFSVAGHRDTLFRGMGEVRKDDLIQFDTLDTSYFYEVASTQIVAPEDVSVLKPGAYPELTLVTCYPFNYIGSAPERFIVKARELYRTPALQQSGVQEPVPAPAQTIKSDVKPERVSFTIATDHSRQLAPGISLGVTSTDIGHHQMSGWMWLMPDRRTVWLRDHGTQDPLVFYGHGDGKRRELVITRVTANSVSGYLIL
jgi:LPXTG-site transpeptidase (sortase) family protein